MRSLLFVLSVFSFFLPLFADKELERSAPLIVSNLGLTIPPESVPFDDISSANKRMFDWANAGNGAFGTSDCRAHTITANLPLESISIYSAGLSYFPADCNFEVHFLRPVYIDTIVYRAYDNNIVSHYFTKFETTTDGMTWNELIPPNTARPPVFQEVFPTRLVKSIRMQGFSHMSEGEITNTSANDKLAITKFQAFFANQGESS
jgi:hypothetical protein